MPIRSGALDIPERRRCPHVGGCDNEVTGSYVVEGVTMPTGFCQKHAEARFVRAALTVDLEGLSEFARLTKNEAMQRELDLMLRVREGYGSAA